MNRIRTSLTRGAFALAVLGSIGFGASQAFASPNANPDELQNDCSTCARQCGTIALCYPGYCQCG